MVMLFAELCRAQLTSSGCAGETNYTDGQPNDAVYFFPSGVNGDLTVTPEVAGNSFTFKWYRFITGTNAWALYQTVNNVPNSTLNNLIPAAYQVVVIQGGNTVGCYRAWIAQILVEPQVNIEPIGPGCNGPIALQGSYTPGQMTAISNLPEAQLLINSDTQISVCFSGNHTWISDLAFYVKGPATCGSPTVLLSPNPGAIGQGAACNSSNNINNLCFSTESNNNLNVCSGMNGLSGTYGSYGPAATPINWAGLYGCDAMNGGWTVQIYDCIALDVGALTDATITFNGTDICGNVQNATYSTPNGYSSVINDNSCSATTASSYIVDPAVPPLLLNCTFGYEWTSDPPVNIPNSTSSLNITINNLTSPSGTALSWQDVEFTLTATTVCTNVTAASQCWGGNMSDSETYTQIPTVQAEITETAAICIENGAINLTATPTGGTWTGPGITDNINGVFDPINSGLGTHTVSYDFNNPCISPDQFDIQVNSQPNNPLPETLMLCPNANPYTFGQPTFQAIFDGSGIVNPLNGTFDPTITGPGAFEVSLSANTFCPATFTTQIEVTTLPDIIHTSDTTICANNAASLFASGAQNYQWSPFALFVNPNSPNPSITVNGPQNITLLATDQNGCESEETLQINVFDPPSIIVEDANIICAGEQGTLLANVSSGSLAWLDTLGNVISTDNPLLQTITSTSEFTAQITDQCGVTASATAQIPVESGYTIFAGNDLGVCEGDSIVLTANTGFLTYDILQWTTLDGVFSGNPNTTSIITSSAGSYTITGTTSLGCIYTDEVNVIVNSLPNVSAGDALTLCSEVADSVSASGAVEYQWSPAELFANANSANTTITATTSGTLLLTGTDSNGCIAIDEVDYTVLDAPQITIEPFDSICPGESIQLLASGNYTNFSWLDSFGNIISNSSDVIVAPTATSIYTALLTSDCDVDATIDVTLPVESLYIIDLPDETNLCAGTSIQLNGNVSPNNAQIQWSTANGVIATDSGEEIITIASVGMYHIALSTPLGCYYADSISVNQYPLPNIFAGNDAYVCYNQPYMLSASGGASYVWSPSSNLSNSNISNPLVTIVSEATYYLTGTDANGCIGLDTIHLDLFPLPEITIDPVSMICPGSSINLNANANYSNIDWTPNFGLNTTTASNVQAAPPSTTNYTAVLTDDNCGYTDEASVWVEVESGISISAGADQSFCEGGSVIIQAETDGTYANLNWSSPNGANFSLAGSTAIITNQSGVFTANIESPLGCQYSDEVEITEIMYPVVNMEDSISFCPGSSVTIAAPGAYDNIFWSNGDNSAETSISTEGLYTVNVFNESCGTSDTFFVYQVMMPYFELGADREICEGESLTIDVGIEGQWGNGTVSSQIIISQEGTYTFTVEEAGCFVSDQVYVEVNELPHYEFVTPQYACIGENHILQPTGVNASYFVWEDGQIGETLSVDAPGNYYVIAYNECGSTIANVEVIFQDCEGLVFIPNCFTPDGDGINDVWMVVGTDIISMKLKIFNRWGDIVYSSNQLNPVWTGGYKDGEYYLPDGIYFFDLEMILARGETVTREGSIRMLR